MMNITRLIEAAPDWVNQTWAQRVDQAASLMFLHGYITQTQRAKIADKMNRQFEEAVANGEIVERKEPLK